MNIILLGNKQTKYKYQQINYIFIIKIILKATMCSGCNPGCSSRPRIRNTPTFYHHPIFGQSECCGGVNRYPRCTPTYHSNVFGQHCQKKTKNCRNNQAINSKQVKCCQDILDRTQEDHRHKINNYDPNQDSLDERETQPKQRPYSASKQPKMAKQISFNPHCSTFEKQKAGSHNVLSNHTLLWYNPEKQILLRECSNCHHHGLPRQRKLLELSSCPFYTNNSAQLIEAARCHRCSGLTSCPFCGGALSCGRCISVNYPNGCKCKQWNNQNDVCTCGPCKKCGCGDTGQFKRSEQQPQRQNDRQMAYEHGKKLNCCSNCADSCPCTNQCFCNQSCICCAKKQFYRIHQSEKQERKGKKESNCNCMSCCSCGPNCTCGPDCHCCINAKSTGCGCSNGCKCGYDCTCGSVCKCCPKFLPYGQCVCNDRCVCGPNCKCQSNCKCCPKYKLAQKQKQCLKKYQAEEKFCKCGPQCGCGPQCRCGSQCRCDQMKHRATQKEQAGFPKGAKTTNVNNGTKKTKNLQTNIRKSEPVFKSITGRRG